MPREFECDDRDTAHFIAAVDLRVERLIAFSTARQSKIDSAEQLANDHEIDATNQITAKRRAIDKRFKNCDRPEIRIIAEQLAQIEEAVLALLARRQVIVFGITHRSEENSFRS